MVSSETAIESRLIMIVQLMGFKPKSLPIYIKNGLGYTDS